MNSLIKKFQIDLDLCSRQKQALKKRKNELVMELFRLREANAKGTVFAPQIQRKKEKFENKFKNNGFMPTGNSSTGGGANDLEASLLTIVEKLDETDSLILAHSNMDKDLERIIDEMLAIEGVKKTQEVLGQVYEEVREGIEVHTMLLSDIPISMSEISKEADRTTGSTKLLKQQLELQLAQKEDDMEREFNDMEREFNEQAQELVRVKRDVNERQKMINGIMQQKNKVEEELERVNRVVAQQKRDMYYTRKKITYGLLTGILLLIIFILVVLILKQKLTQKQSDYKDLELETEDFMNRNEGWRNVVGNLDNEIRQCNLMLQEANKTLNDALDVELFDHVSGVDFSQFVPEIDAPLPEAIIDVFNFGVLYAFFRRRFDN